MNKQYDDTKALLATYQLMKIRYERILQEVAQMPPFEHTTFLGANAHIKSAAEDALHQANCSIKQLEERLENLTGDHL